MGFQTNENYFTDENFNPMVIYEEDEVSPLNIEDETPDFSKIP